MRSFFPTPPNPYLMISMVCGGPLGRGTRRREGAPGDGLARRRVPGAGPQGWGRGRALCSGVAAGSLRGRTGRRERGGSLVGASPPPLGGIAGYACRDRPLSGAAGSDSRICEVDQDPSRTSEKYSEGQDNGNRRRGSRQLPDSTWGASAVRRPLDCPGNGTLPLCRMESTLWQFTK